MHMYYYNNNVYNINIKMCVTELLDCKMYVENNQGTYLICFKFHKNNTNTKENNLNFTNQTNKISDKQEKQRDS